MKIAVIFLVAAFAIYGCSPLKSSSQEERHQMELTLHEVQTNIDDSRHDINCLQTEMQIFDSKMKNQESAVFNLKKQWLEKYQTRLDKLDKLFDEINGEIQKLKAKEKNVSEDIRQLSSHANETTSALSQYKNRINELEKDIFSQNKKLEEVAKLNSTLQTVMKSLREVANNKNDNVYKVKLGDSLEKIAKTYKISIEEIKNANGLEQDLIVIGQELIIPNKK